MENSNLKFKVLKTPYYTCEFKNVPNNPFSQVLLCYLGEISKKYYDKYLDVFVKTLQMPDVNSKDLEYDPEKRFPLNKDLPKNAYLFTLSKGEFQENFNSSTDLLQEILSIVQEENSDYIGVYDILADFFRLSCKFYSNIDTLFEKNAEDVWFKTIKSSKEVYFFIDENNTICPIFEQQIDGAVVCKSLLFNYDS